MRFKHQAKGQGMTEYIIIVALIAIAGIVVVQLFGDQLRTQFAGMTAEMGGTNSRGIATSMFGARVADITMRTSVAFGNNQVCSRV